MPGVAASPINATTRCCAVLGFPIEHSASPAMHNPALKELGLNWRYLAFSVPPEDLRHAIEGAKSMHFVGLNLTVPHKLLAFDMVDALDESARTWGAVNTIRFEFQNEKGEWISTSRQTNGTSGPLRSHGFNTDADAISRALDEDLGIKLRHSRVLVLGAGGAGRVAALKIAAEGAATLFLVNRTQQRAKKVAAEINKRFPSTQVTVGYPDGEVDLIINGTSLGLKPSDPLPLDEQRFSLGRTRAVYDMIYQPAETSLLKAAKSAGCRTANGMSMLLFQGAKALEIWSGKKPPVAVMRRALEQEIYG